MFWAPLIATSDPLSDTEFYRIRGIIEDTFEFEKRYNLGQIQRRSGVNSKHCMECLQSLSDRGSVFYHRATARWELYF